MQNVARGLKQLFTGFILAILIWRFCQPKRSQYAPYMTVRPQSFHISAQGSFGPTMCICILIGSFDSLGSAVTGWNNCLGFPPLIWKLHIFKALLHCASCSKHPPPFFFCRVQFFSLTSLFCLAYNSTLLTLRTSLTGITILTALLHYLQCYPYYN